MAQAIHPFEPCGVLVVLSLGWGWSKVDTRKSHCWGKMRPSARILAFASPADRMPLFKTVNGAVRTTTGGRRNHRRGGTQVVRWARNSSNRAVQIRCQRFWREGCRGLTKFGHWCRPGRKARILGRKRRRRWATGGKVVAEKALAGARLHALCAPLRQRQARERAA